MESALPLDNPVDQRMYRSRYGGLWVDRRDAHDILADRHARGLISEVDADHVAHYIDHGYVVFGGAVSADLLDEYLAFLERCWDDPSSPVWVHSGGKLVRMSRDLYDDVAKVASLHAYFPRAGELLFPLPVLRFLTQIYDRPPVAFQTMSMRLGSEEPLHLDSGPLSLTEPMSLAASWLALEDVRENSGEFEFVPGCHRLPEQLYHGTTKAHNGDMLEYGRVLAKTLEMCKDRGLKTERFMARAGDVLIWHGDLMHGGAVIEDRSRTRKSLVTHFMPLGVMPTFYDFSKATECAYPTGGNCLDDRDVARSTPSMEPSWKQRVPMPVKAFARRHVDRLSSHLK
jgi:phytanoyl-CoA hydroxylase